MLQSQYESSVLRALGVDDQLAHSTIRFSVGRFGLGKQLRYSQKHIWHWRDWIIESLNEDKGYDRMIVEMLAADEIAPTDAEALRADLRSLLPEHMVPAGISVMDRHLARAFEALKVAKAMREWLHELDEGSPVHADYGHPASGTGVGVGGGGSGVSGGSVVVVSGGSVVLVVGGSVVVVVDVVVVGAGPGHPVGAAQHLVARAEAPGFLQFVDVVRCDLRQARVLHAMLVAPVVNPGCVIV